MSDFVKMAGMVIGVAVTMYVMLQQHEYRLSRVESTIEQHLQKHELQNEAIQKTLTQIQIQLGGMAEQEPEAKPKQVAPTRAFR
jgi:transcriptional regulator NrdR family protein